jgi:hypothetical protein
MAKKRVPERKVIETISYNGRYVDVATFRNKLISAGIALLTIVSAAVIIFF